MLKMLVSYVMQTVSVAIHYPFCPIVFVFACTVFCNDGDLRLIGGAADGEGRVEVCIGEVWGTVCDNSWNAVDARVACRILGFSGVSTCSNVQPVLAYSCCINSPLFSDAVAVPSAFFGRGTGPVFLDDLRCAGTERSLLDCPRNSMMSNCGHSEDAGVRCQGMREFSAPAICIRL